MAKLDVGHLGAGPLAVGSLGAASLGTLGEYIRDQRRNAQYSLRQLADAAGVSNPYLSQIERGLRKPSAEILQQIAKALRISAETLYVRAGILEERDGDHDVTVAVLADPVLNDRQKRVLLDIYASFVRENAAAHPQPHEASDEPSEQPERRPRKRTAAASSKRTSSSRARRPAVDKS